MAKTFQIHRRHVPDSPTTATVAPPSVDRALAATGRPLEPAVRREMEHRIGHDFSRVRVHTGPDAERSASELHAHAYTVNHNIAFGEHRYAPFTQSGKRLLAHELAHVVQQADVVQPYRDKKAFNFGKTDDALLVEDSFSVRQDKEKKPWISKVTVEFSSKQADSDGNNFWAGTATAEYYANAVKWADFSFPVSGGSADRASLKSDKGNFTVHRIEGVGYNSGSFSGTPGVDYDPADREGPGKRYSKSLSANMHYAVFYNGGEALHGGPLGAGSHGCVHVDTSGAAIKQLNYHSVIGLTKVKVSYV